MANYNTIRGLRVKYLSADPANPENGQVWYNSTTGNLRVEGMVLAASWASAPSINTARAALSGGSGAGTQAAALIFGGSVPPSTQTNKTEEFNGSSWSEVTNFPLSAEWQMAVGTQAAAITFGGYTPSGDFTSSFDYDGTNWTANPNLNIAGRVRTGFGTQTAAIAAAGSPRSGIGDRSESWNGSAWTNGPNTGSQAEGRGGMSGSPQTAGLIFGGSAPSPELNVESWDGSSWSEVNNMANKRRYTAGFGTASGGVAVGGNNTSQLSACEIWDGTNFSTDAAMGTARTQFGNAAAAPSTAGFVYAGGIPGGPTTTTEQYTGATTQIKNLSTS